MLKSILCILFSFFSVNQIVSQNISADYSVYQIEKQNQKFIIGLELRTTNEECSQTIPAHWHRAYVEKIWEKIPNRIGTDVTYALYTDYEGDETKPYSYVIGFEVSSLDNIPEGLVGKVVPESAYAVFKAEGKFPESVVNTWQGIWKTSLDRSFSGDFELYNCNFDPTNPEIKVYIAIKD